MVASRTRLAFLRCVLVSAICIAIALVIGLFFGGSWGYALAPALGYWLTFPWVLRQERQQEETLQPS